MLYDNCSKYVYNELIRIMPITEWKNNKIVVYGLDVLSKTVISILTQNGIENITIVDRDKKGGVWADIEILSPKETLTAISSNNNLSIIVTPQKSHLIISNEIIKINPDFKECILDLSYIRMDSMPNIFDNHGTVKNITLRDCQLEMLGLLKEFTEFCDNNNLRYFLDYGTLLGSVRHNGFIPWDDDLDVAMPMPDYLRFCELYKDEKSEIMSFDSVSNSETKDLSVSTLSKLKSKRIVTEYCSFPVRYMSGIALDIFPLCGYPTDLDEQESYLKEFHYYADVWKEKVVIPYGTEKYSRELHLDIWQKMMEIACRYDYEKSEYVAPAYFGVDTYLSNGNRVMPKIWYSESIKQYFENILCNIPKGYDGVLSKWYGDYMKLPPVEDQVPHDTKSLYVVNDYSIYE